MYTTVIICYLIVIAFYCVVLPGIFEKADIEKSKGFIPLYNFYVLITKMLGEPWYWTLVLIFPGINLIMLASLNVMIGRRFNLYTLSDTIKHIYLPFIQLPTFAFTDKHPYKGPMDWSDAQMRENRKAGDHWVLFNAAPILGHLFYYVLGGSKQKNKKNTTPVFEWGGALIFAIIAASIIRGYALEAFTIPTSSMEKDMLRGDFLFVSKLHYGLRLPETPLSVPFMHNTLPGTIPFLGIDLPWKYKPSYVRKASIPYTRLPKLFDIKRFDRVVFYFPTGDTALLGYTPQTSELQGHNYYSFLRNQANILYQIDCSQQAKTPTVNEYINKKGMYENKARTMLLENNNMFVDGGRNGLQNLDTYGYAVRPTDKKENYIKRCVAIPGDVLEFRNGVLHIDGQKNEVMGTQHFYQCTFNRALYKKERALLKEHYDITSEDIRETAQQSIYFINMSDQIHNELTGYFKLSNSKNTTQLQLISSEITNDQKDSTLTLNNMAFDIYPNDPAFNWTKDNFGPLWMPKQGESIALNDSTYILYKRCIQTYEGNTLEKKADGFYINGQKTDRYTFKQGYYFLVGDNRHNSADSRYWGFVPHDHVVGKAVFRWISIDPDLPWSKFMDKMRWSRFLKVVHD